MGVSKLVLILGFVFVAALCFAISPVVAGEHPWDENDNPGGGTGHPGNGQPHPGNDTIESPLYTSPPMFGTSWWWWEILVDGPRVNKDAHETASSVPMRSKTGVDPQPTCKTER